MQTAQVSRELIRLVEQAIYQNTTQIVIPPHLLADANPETLHFMRELCRLNGLKIEGSAVPQRIPIRRRLGLGLERYDPDETPSN